MAAVSSGIQRITLALSCPSKHRQIGLPTTGLPVFRSWFQLSLGRQHRTRQRLNSLCHSARTSTLLTTPMDIRLIYSFQPWLPSGRHFCSPILRSTSLDSKRLRASKFSVFKIVILLVYYTIPFGFSLFWHFWVISLQLFKLLCLANDHWQGFSSRNAHMVGWLHHPLWLKLLSVLFGIIFHLFQLNSLAKDHWRGFNTRHAHMVHTVN